MKKKRKILTLAAFALALGVGAGISAFTETKTATATTETPILEIYKKNLSFKESIYILYAIDAQNVATTDEFGLLVWNTPQESYEYETATSVVTDKYTATISGTTYPTFYYTDLVAKEMTDVVYSRAYVKRDGEYYYSDVDKYSILEYAYNKLGKTDKEATTDTKLKALLESMLAYGGAAQIYTDYKTDTLASDDFTYVQIVNAKFEDGFDYGLYKAGTQVKVIPDEGYALGGNAADYYSTDENGDIILTVPQAMIDEDATGGSFEEIPQTSQGLAYKLNSDGVSYSVTGIGECTDSEIVIPDTYEGLPVTAIGESAFSNCKTLTSIEMPESITEIGGFSFGGCGNLTYVNIPKTVTEIKQNTFWNCGSLTNFEIHSNITSIASTAFWNCWSLENIKVDKDNAVYKDVDGNVYSKNDTVLVKYADGKKDSEFEIPETITTINECAFMSKYLVNVIIPDSIFSISEGSFTNCSNLQYSEYGNSKYLGNKTNPYLVLITGLRNRTDYSIHDDTKILAKNSFHSSYVGYNLTNIDFGENLMVIGDFAFFGCTKLTSIELPNNVTTIGRGVFSGCSGLTSVNIGENVTSIGEGAFNGCSIEKITAPASWMKTIIRNGSSSSSLKEAIITSGEKIERVTFNSFTNLESIEIPNSIILIEEHTFTACDNLTTVYFKGTPEEWTNIQIGLGNENLKNANIIYEVDECNYSKQVIAPTCTEQGYTVYTCECGDTYNGDYVNALGHNFTNYISDNNATCTADGTKTASCDNGCGTTDTVTETALGHNIEKHIGQTATCTANGWKAYETCTRCDYTTYEIIVATGHSYSTQVIAPTCTKQGYTIYTCVTCGDTYNGNYVNATGHNFTNYISDNNATCTADGTKTASCDNGCGTTDTVTETALGHNIEKHAGQAATCTANGWKAYETCTRCDYTTYEIIVATGHKYATQVIAPTCTEQGYTVYTCECGNTYNGDYVNATGHSYTNYVSDNNATCTEDGTKTASCDNGCGTVDTLKDVGSISGHNFVEQVCTWCTERGSAELAYTLNSDGVSYSVSQGNCLDEEIVIPKTHKGLPITSIKSISYSTWQNITSIEISDSVEIIEDSTFSNCGNLTNLILGKSVVEIGERAFEYCNGLKSIIIENSIETIGAFAFYNCKGLERVDVGPSVKVIGNGAFCDCSNLTEISIADSITSLGNSPFSGCPIEEAIIDGKWISTCIKNNAEVSPLKKIIIIGDSIGDNALTDCVNLKEVTIMSSVSSIGQNAFSGCTGLEDITIPSNIISIGKSAFNGCNNLKSITLPFIGNKADGQQNNYLGYIFGAETPRKSEDFVPDSLNTVKVTSTKTLAEGAFAYCDNIKTVELSNTLESIGGMAFLNCTSLISITIPDSVVTIGGDAFTYCASLESVILGKSLVSIGIGAFNLCERLTNITFANPNGWTAEGIAISSTDLANTKTAATYLKSTYFSYAWTRTEE